MLHLFSHIFKNHGTEVMHLPFVVIRLTWEHQNNRGPRLEHTDR